MGDLKIRWTKTGNAQWTANVQKRNGTDYSAVINLAANVYTLTINPGAVVTMHPNLHAGKNRYRKYLFTK